MTKKSNGQTSRWHSFREKRVNIPLIMVILWGIVSVVLVLMLWSIKRRQDPHLQVKNPGELHQLLPSLVGMTQGSLEEGNHVTVLQNGVFFDAVLRDIAAAKQSVHFETFVWWKGEICDRIARALADKAKQGVEVRVLLDASGSSRMDDNLWDLMEEAGVEVAKFHPVRFSNIGRLNNRDHRKIVVIDGRIGYLGGHGVAEEWTGNAQDKKHWRDTFVRLEGPIVNKLQGAFSENWIEETGKIPAGPQYYPKLSAAGKSSVHLAYSSPAGSVSSVQLLYYLAITAARKRLIIQNPYFLPDNDAIEALRNAGKRGVDVQIMMPSDDATDNAIVQHASHHHFGTLLKAGVRVFEYRKTLLHQKVMIVDRQWSCVGSTNFDDRSFEINDEISAGILDPEIAAQLEAAYADDMRSATERKLEEWRNRSLWHKLVDGAAFALNEQL